MNGLWRMERGGVVEVDFGRATEFTKPHNMKLKFIWMEIPIFYQE